MKITIISPFSFGYIEALVNKLKEYPNVEVVFIQTSKLSFEYDSLLQKGYNFFLKTFKGRNLKTEFKTTKILEQLDGKGKQDHILIIRPDKLEESLLIALKPRTQNLVSYYYDGLDHIPEKLKLIKYFHVVYSYDKSDVKKHGLKFITNFIPQDIDLHHSEATGVFNVSSYDERAVVIQKIATQLQKNQFPFRFYVQNDKRLSLNNIEVLREYMSIEEVKSHLKESSILLDIQKHDQLGLSFRVFEAMGYNKKLITTNQDVKNYDFYRPENILIIDKNDPKIPKQFLNEPVHPLPETIKNRYRREAWIKEVFGLKL